MDDLQMLCRNAVRIFVYGAGKNAEKVYLWLSDNGFKLDGYLVTSIDNNPEMIHGIRVEEYDSWMQKKGDLVISSMRPKTRAYFQVFELLEKRNVRNVFFFSDEELNKLGEKKETDGSGTIELHDVFDQGEYRYVETAPVERNHYVFSQMMEGKCDYRWRFSEYYFRRLEGKRINDFFVKLTALDEFQEIYGDYNVIPTSKIGNEHDVNCKIYMAASLANKWAIEYDIDPWIEPIQVGTALGNKRIFNIQDDNGDNISNRNKNWSEGTAIYWMWKNARPTDYVGLCHYRRRLAITKQQLENIVTLDIDAVVTIPTFVFDSTYDFLKLHTPQTDFSLLAKKIREICPQYFDAYETFSKARFYPPCNLFLMKWEIFHMYCEMALPVCLAIDEYYYGIGYRRKDRYMGYLLEVLLGVFLIKNKNIIKTAYTDMVFISEK